MTQEPGARRAPHRSRTTVTLPNAHLALIEERKVTDYLLNGAHPDNGGKARFFNGLGFSTADVAIFITALRHVAETGNVVERIESAYGVKFVVDGALPAQAGTSARTVRTVWIIERGENVPRLVTAYPNED
jgi:hypothetical protein